MIDDCCLLSFLADVIFMQYCYSCLIFSMMLTVIVYMFMIRLLQLSCN